MGKIDKGIIYGKLYNSESRTFLIRTGEKFIDETGQYVEYKKYAPAKYSKD